MTPRYFITLILLGTICFFTFFITCANTADPSSEHADIQLHLIWKSSGKEVASTGVSLLYITIAYILIEMPAR
jgi:hypothetical protein